MILDCPRCQHRFPLPAPVTAGGVCCPRCGTPCPIGVVPAVPGASPLSLGAPLPAAESASRADPGLLSTAAFSLPHTAGDTAATARAPAAPHVPVVPGGGAPDETLIPPATATVAWPDGFDPVPGYDFRRVLGRGGMGVVLQARHTALDREVAVKLPLAGAWTDDEDRERFLREARAAAKLRHPNICPIYEIGQVGQRPYISMAYIEGQSLAHWAKARQPNARQAAEMVALLARAVAYAHEHGVLHRDLKPANVMVDAETGGPVLMDFGLAKETTSQSSQLTQEGRVLGTPAYMAPEQAAGQTEHVGPRADVYALGAVLYYLLCGRAPFEGSSGDVLRRVQTDPPLPPRKLVPHTHRDLETICLKAMAKQPADRYASATALAEDLERFGAGEAILARRQGLLARGWRRIRRRPLTTTVALLLVLATAGLGYRAVHQRQVNCLQRAIDDVAAARQWTQPQLARADALIEQLRRLDAWEADQARRAFDDRFAAAIRETIGQPRLTPEAVAQVESQLALLAVRDEQLAQTVREELGTRVRDWQTMFDLEPPFERLAEVFSGQPIRIDGGSLLSSGAVALTPFRCPALARLEAELAEPRPKVPQLRLCLGADGSAGRDKDAYSFLLDVPAPAAPPGQKSPPSSAPQTPAPPQPPAASPPPGQTTDVTLRLRILRGVELLREATVSVAPGPLAMSATRHADRLTLQVNQLPPVEFFDAFPIPEADRRVFAVQWSEGSRLRRVRASTRLLAPAPSPLEMGDALYARAQFADALAQYQRQAIDSGNTAFGQEARLKQALCLIALQQKPAALDLLERLASEPGERWPLMAGCRLWQLRLEQDKLDEAAAILDRLTSRFTSDQVRPLISTPQISLITGKYHDRSMCVYLFLYNPREIPDLEHTRTVFEFLGQRGPVYDATRFLLCRAYFMKGRHAEALRLSTELIAEDCVLDTDPRRQYQLQELQCWLLRLQGKPQAALAALDRHLLDSTGAYRQQRIGLLVERARIHAALGQWDQAAKDLDDLRSRATPKQLTYTLHAAAALLQGFLLERQGNHDGAAAAWRAGLPGEGAPVSWEKMDSIESFGHALILASLTKQFTAREVDVLLDRAIRRVTMTIDPSVVKATLRIFLADLTPEQMAALTCGAAARPRTRELARQAAFRELPIGQLLRGAVMVTAIEIASQLLSDGPLSSEQEELCAELADAAYTAYTAGQLHKDQLMQLMFTYRGLTETLGWSSLAKSLDPALRGPLAYWMGHRFLRLRQPAQADQLFVTAMSDAAPGSRLHRLAAAERAKLQKKP